MMTKKSHYYILILSTLSDIKNNYAFGFQGHPEASPGPNDIIELFKKFIEIMDMKKNA